MFLPTTKHEMNRLGWDRADVILVTGDSYIDSPYIGVALIGKVLHAAGFRTAVIAQPDLNSDTDIGRLGEPLLFWGVSSGSVDSMVANYTAAGKRRNTDDYTPGGINNRRPDRALIQYTNLIRQYFKKTAPIVLGGLEASLRRVSHYDVWSNRIRKSVLFDAKGDYLVYGMAEKTVTALASALKNGESPEAIPGLCYISGNPREGYIELPSHDEVATDKDAFILMFHTFYRNNDPLTAIGLYQKQGDRYLIHNPPSPHLTTADLDAVHDLPFERDLHPYYRKQGDVRALDTIRFSLPIHRGCYGECRFCAITIHQGRTVTWRSESSILKEAEAMARHPLFKGTISDAGGPTANMYGFECQRKITKGACTDKRCLYPTVCPNLKPDHGPLIQLLRKLRAVKGVKHVFSASGIRYDLVLADKAKGPDYLAEIVRHHVSGQLKIAPEHSEKDVLDLMGKPGTKDLLSFKRAFDDFSRRAGKKQFLTYYLIAAHPGCRDIHMTRLRDFVTGQLGIRPEQIQVFTPTPSTYATLMYETGIDPFTGKSVFVEKTNAGRERQKTIILGNAKGKTEKRKPVDRSGGHAKSHDPRKSGRTRKKKYVKSETEAAHRHR